MFPAAQWKNWRLDLLLQSTFNVWTKTYLVHLRFATKPDLDEDRDQPQICSHGGREIEAREKRWSSTATSTEEGHEVTNAVKVTTRWNELHGSEDVGDLRRWVSGQPLTPDGGGWARSEGELLMVARAWWRMKEEGEVKFRNEKRVCLSVSHSLYKCFSFFLYVRVGSCSTGSIFNNPLPDPRYSGYSFSNPIGPAGWTQSGL